MCTFGLLYLVLIIAFIIADVQFVRWNDFHELVGDRRVRYSMALSLISSSISAILAVWLAVPTGYALARLGRDAIERRWENFPNRRRFALAARYAIDTVLDIPIFLPPLVVGISLLVLFQTPAGRWLNDCISQVCAVIGVPQIRGITYEIPAVILSQFTVSAAFAIRTMRETFEQTNPRSEQIAATLGASPAQTFRLVALPQAWRGCVAAFTLAWARSIGEFGPILIFAGTARMKTEVLSTTIYLNFQMGNLRGAVAASLILVTIAIVVLISMRWLMLDRPANGSGVS